MALGDNQEDVVIFRIKHYLWRVLYGREYENWLGEKND
jgi:hypothetical protein